MFGYGWEFFDTFTDAEGWARRYKAGCLIGVYGLDRASTKQKFIDLLNDAVFWGQLGEHSAGRVRAVVVWNRL